MTPVETLRAAAAVLHDNPDGPVVFEVNLATGVWIAINTERIPASLEEWLTSAADRWHLIRGHWEAVHALAAASAVLRSHNTGQDPA